MMIGFIFSFGLQWGGESQPRHSAIQHGEGAQNAPLQRTYDEALAAHQGSWKRGTVTQPRKSWKDSTGALIPSQSFKNVSSTCG